MIRIKEMVEKFGWVDSPETRKIVDRHNAKEKNRESRINFLVNGIMVELEDAKRLRRNRKNDQIGKRGGLK